MQKINTLLLFLGLLLLGGCAKQINTEKELLQWLSDPKNGLIKTKLSGDKSLTVRYMPPYYMAYLELGNCPWKDDRPSFDSLTHFYSRSMNFMLTVKYADDNLSNNDVLLEYVNNYHDYNLKSIQANFSLSENILLYIDDSTCYKPVLALMENTYGLQKHRNFHLVFSPANQQDLKMMTSTKFDLVFKDVLFGTGINHFIFKKADLKKEVEFISSK